MVSGEGVRLCLECGAVRKVFASSLAITDDVAYLSCVMKEGIITKGYVRMAHLEYAVGEVFVLGRYRYECVVAPRRLLPCEACLGCVFARKRRNCNKLKCSPFDRSDGRFVWFKEVGDGE